MKFQHRCSIELIKLPWGVAQVTRRWVCPECGQNWSVTQHSNSTYSSTRYGGSGVKHWLWQRKMRREYKRSRNA